MCATQTGYKSHEGARVIVNVHSRYILMWPRMPSTQGEETKKERRGELGAAEFPRDEKKVTRDLVDEDRANNPASYRSLAVSLRIVNRRCQEIRERGAASQTSFLWMWPRDSRSPRIIMSTPDYTCLDIVRRAYEYLHSIDDKILSYSRADVLRKLFASLCTS